MSFCSVEDAVVSSLSVAWFLSLTAVWANSLQYNGFQPVPLGQQHQNHYSTTLTQPDTHRSVITVPTHEFLH